MGNWSIPLIFIILVSLVGCESNVKSDNNNEIRKEYMSLLNEELDKKNTLKNYLDGEIELVNGEPHNVESMQFYEFVLKANLNNEFRNLTDEERYELFKELDSAYIDSFCGEHSHCNIDTFTFYDDGDTYIVSPSYGFEITKNDENFDPAPVPDADTSEINSSINKQTVYDFMKSKYDDITNYGNNYNPEVHDPLVAKLAAEQFGISENEAGQIYNDMEMGAR